MKTYTRREMLACLMAGGVVTASGLWWPGKKLISIPKERPFPHGWSVIEDSIDDGLYSIQSFVPLEYAIRENLDHTVDRNLVKIYRDAKYVEVHPHSDLPIGGILRMSV